MDYFGKCNFMPLEKQKIIWGGSGLRVVNIFVQYMKIIDGLEHFIYIGMSQKINGVKILGLK